MATLRLMVPEVQEDAEPRIGQVCGRARKAAESMLFFRSVTWLMPRVC